MEENNNLNQEENTKQVSIFKFSPQDIFKQIVLNWKWFILSLIICLGVAAIYLRYTTPRYQAVGKLYIKDDDTRRRSMLSYRDFGTMSNSLGMETEMEILKSRSLAEQVVRDLKLYVNYTTEGKVKDVLVYKNQPVSVDLDPAHLESLSAPIYLEITYSGGKYHVTGHYAVAGTDYTHGGTYNLDRTLTTLPATIGTKAGYITFTKNRNAREGEVSKVTISSPVAVSYKYKGGLSVTAHSESGTIAILTFTDENTARACDYIKQLVIDYNRQANEDKNEVARRTEEFINGRIEKINNELGNTDSQLEKYKRSNRIVNLAMNSGQSLSNSDEYSKKLSEANTQVALMNSIQESMRNGEKYQTLPANVGITDNSINQMIDKYNTIALERKRLLRSASENSPTVTPLTDQLDDLINSIDRAMQQAKKNFEIQRNAIASQYGKYTGQTSESPEQERILTEIGRQQEVRSGLYLMLLQKREENSISLSATANKGKLIDAPEAAGKVSPKNNFIMLVALLAGLLIPAIIILIIELLRYKIEGHDDVARLTKLPILADVPLASETAKTKADIVVHENHNSSMQEVFRFLRTNLQFMLKDGEKVILATSSTSGEGKIFIIANLANSFALLGKKVVLVGLDIRKPRLAELFEIDDNSHGITPLLVKSNPTWEDVKSQLLPSGVNNNLELLMSGPIPPNPSELVARQSLDIIINHLKDHFDYIMLDTAPVGLVTDSLQIGRVANVTIFICRADFTTRDSFGLINSLADEHKLPNMSIVLNGIDMSKKKYGYYYGYGRYGKYKRYNHYGKYDYYGSYGSYSPYSQSDYGDKNDMSFKH